MTNAMTASNALQGTVGRSARAASGPTLLERLGAWLEEQRAYRKTVAELERMDDRELADIGMSRVDIRRIAREAARAERLQAA